MRRRFIIVVVSAVALLAVLVGFNIFKKHIVANIMKQNAGPPQTVSTAAVRYSDWQPEVGAIGSLRAVHGVDITTEVTGLVRSVLFKSGDEARSGQVLVELNADSDIAQQHALEAAAELSNTVYTRDKVQYEAQAISKAQLDADAADLKNKRAQVAAQAAIVAKKTLRAPFAGRLGITTVNPGQYLDTGAKVVTLQAVDPIYVDFKLPQQQLAQVSIGETVKLSVDAFPGVTFTGKVNAMDPLVDPSTRNFQAEATIANSERKLLPGMFGRVAVTSGDVQHYLTIPQTAVAYNPYGATVFLAQGETPHLTAQQSFVTLGPSRGDQVAVLKGLDEGAVIVTSGQLKLTNGTRLIVDNSVQPRNDPNPVPQEE
jgi:membrane fusion protein (multidrug efflux system)